MSADEFFNKYSLEEIHNRTKISPVSLKLIKNREFEKIPRVKFVGFVRLMEKNFKVDLSDLIEEYDNYFKTEKNEKKEKKIKIKNSNEKKNNNYIWIIATIFLIIIAIISFKLLNNPQKNKEIIIEKNNPSKEINNSNELNNSFEEIKQTNFSNQDIQLNKTIKEKNTSSKSDNLIKNENNTTAIKEYNITIIPKRLVWFRAINIDTNKTKEYLTSKTKILSGNYYIKFGHGDILIIYNDKNISPNPKEMVRILFKNGKYQFLQKPNKYEK